MESLEASVNAPSKAILALAIAIVKHKPPDKEVKDYLMEVRHFIRNDLQVESPDKFFDSVAFWQKAYKESEAEQAKLLNQIFELEQRTQGLRSKMKQSQSAVDPFPRNQKVSTENLKGLVPPRKKARGRDSKPELSKSTRDDEEEEASEEENAPKLTRQLYTVQRALQKRHNSKPLTTDAVTLCKVAESEIWGATIRLNAPESQSKIPSSQQAKKPDLIAVTKATELSFKLVHQALHKVIGAPDESYCKGQITYYLVCLFESIMGALTQICTASTRTATSTILQETSKCNRIPTRKQGNSQKIQKKKETVTSKAKRLKMEKDATECLLDLLCTMALSLDLTRSDDQDVMEGYLFIVIHRVGKMLALFVFEDHQLPSDSCPDIDVPQGIRDMKAEGLTNEMAQVEAEHLIRLLHRMLSSRLCDTEIMHSQFIRNMHRRLQKTLIQAVFGDDDPLFREGLVRPGTPPPLDDNGRASQRQDFSEWFTEELWRLVGWDILNNIPQRA
ncbi:hypothetical protein N7520_011195 [Penicillium odoratum]|uniref:uncharacterized protein n=1 Tax=Penicillium odoratum TaxID=1167516 RepID=UPI0025481DCC|nr:uncharacterized protein N7520_011195 [Penicillium odoratum]KAJ5746013.1 hypothetical protein N7520_011195 [Penicillium odoratum]